MTIVVAILVIAIATSNKTVSSSSLEDKTRLLSGKRAKVVIGDRLATAVIANAPPQLEGSENVVPPSGGLFNPVRVDPTKTRLTFPLVDDKNYLTSQAIDYIGLNEKESIEIQNLLNQYRKAMVALTSENISVDKIRGDFEKGTYAFIIAPFSQKGRDARENLVKKIEQLSGKDHATKFVDVFNWHNSYGAGGELETLVTFQEELYGENRIGIRADWEQRDPATGKVLRKSSGDINDFYNSYGEIVNIEFDSD